MGLKLPPNFNRPYSAEIPPLATVVRDVAILDKLTQFLGTLLDRGGVPMWMLFPKTLPGQKLEQADIDAAEAWSFNDSADCWSTEPVRTLRTKKVPRNHVKAEATEKHPAQVEMYFEDVLVGNWTTVKYSSQGPWKPCDEAMSGAPGPPFRYLYAHPTARSTPHESSSTGTDPTEWQRSHIASAPAACAIAVISGTEASHPER